jgi:hypothetical protein
LETVDIAALSARKKVFLKNKKKPIDFQLYLTFTLKRQGEVTLSGQGLQAGKSRCTSKSKRNEEKENEYTI